MKMCKFRFMFILCILVCPLTRQIYCNHEIFKAIVVSFSVLSSISALLTLQSILRKSFMFNSLACHLECNSIEIIPIALSVRLVQIRTLENLIQAANGILLNKNDCSSDRIVVLVSVKQLNFINFSPKVYIARISSDM